MSYSVTPSAFKEIENLKIKSNAASIKGKEKSIIRLSL